MPDDKKATKSGITISRKRRRLYESAEEEAKGPPADVVAAPEAKKAAAPKPAAKKAAAPKPYAKKAAAPKPAAKKAAATKRPTAKKAAAGKPEAASGESEATLVVPYISPEEIARLSRLAISRGWIKALSSPEGEDG